MNFKTRDAGLEINDMREIDISRIVTMDSHRFAREKEYWLNRLSAPLSKSSFPGDWRLKAHDCELAPEHFQVSFEVFNRLMKLSKGNHYTLYIILVTALAVLQQRYGGCADIIVGMPVYKQDSEKNLANTVVALRTRVDLHMTFKQLLMQVRQTVIEADQHQAYPMEALLKQLAIPFSAEDEFPLFDTAILLGNIQDREYIRHIRLNMIFCFHRQENSMQGVLEYNPSLYREETVKRIIRHFNCLLEQLLEDANLEISAVEILSKEEKEQLLYDFNDTAMAYPFHQTAAELFALQVERTPDQIALVGQIPHIEGTGGLAPLSDLVSITYRELNRKSNQLAHFLRTKGTGPGAIVGLLLERTADMMTAILGVIKAGGAYLPAAPDTPPERTRQILEDAGISILLTRGHIIERRNYGFSSLQNLYRIRTDICLTAPRKPIPHLDTLPMPDRSLIDNHKYANNISLAMVKHCISLQGTRGCPYQCAYCARLWPNKQVVRSARHLFAEVEHYYKMGVRRFSIIDDIFNLDVENSRRFFKLIIHKGMNLQLLFPAGLRGDIMTRDYIDLMVEAGTINISAALETASPRLQKLIRKHLDIDKLYKNLQYLCKKHPGVILDLFTMHGLPTETEQEAMMTLDFVKSLKWLHFPLINITRIYPNTHLEKLALESGISREIIWKTGQLSWHEAGETLSFDKKFTSRYQADFLDNYFLKKERLLHVLPYQMNVLTEDEIACKYNSYFPTNCSIESFDDLLEFTGIDREELGTSKVSYVSADRFAVPGLNQKIKRNFPTRQPRPDALRVLLLDLSQAYSRERKLLDDLFEQPLGLLYLLTWLNRQFGENIRGKIAKSGIDFDSDFQLRQLLENFKPQVIGIRTLTFYKDFFHRTVSKIRQWGYDIPIIVGGPYATNGYRELLQDPNINLTVLAEGEIAFAEIIAAIMKNQGQPPSEETLKQIPGIAFIPDKQSKKNRLSWDIIMLDEPGDTLEKQPRENPSILNSTSDPVYTIFTSGSSGTPKGVLVEHRNLHNLVKGLYERIYRRYPNPLQVAVVSPYIFDASVKQLFGALLLGHSLHIVPEDTRADGYRLLEYFKTHQIELTDGTPTHLRLLVETGFEGSGTLCLKHLLIGGEPLPKSVVKEFFSHFSTNPPAITNVYGPTECSVDVTSYEVNAGSPVSESWEIIPIGRPWPNHQCYIFEMYHPYRLQPPGAAGELCISGDGTARGYLNNPELTAEKFCLRRPGGRFLKKLPPWTPRKNFSLTLKGTGERFYTSYMSYMSYIYRTGDLARWLKDGNIAFLGRKDRQVKVRGYRIELEEIETRLLSYSDVKEAIVVVKQDVEMENYLCAYIVWRENPGNPFDIPVLRKYLSGVVPGYMIPGRFVQLEKVPLSPNGKADRKALPEPKISDAGGVYQPPRGPIEEKLVQIWTEILNIAPGVIGIDNDFFQLGGHSLKATILIAKIHKTFDIRIPLQKIFQIPCIRQMAAYIKSNKPIDRFALIKPAPKQDYYQLSSSQKRLYFIQQMDVNNTAYNLVAPVMLEGVLTPEELEHGFRELVRRHDSLRTSFEIVNHEPMQKISPEVEFFLEKYEIEEHKAMDFIEAEVMTPFDLSRAPLGRAILLKIEAQRHILVVTLHHIISDGTSQGILLKEFMTLYQGGQLPPLRLQYKDFSQWQNSKEQLELARKQEKTWLKRLQGELPTLDLPTDFPRPRLQSFEGDVIRFRISKEKMRKITGLISREGVTLYMFLLAVFNVFLFKITGQEDILVGTPVANRRHADLQSIVGLFVNIVVMRNFPTGDQTFTSFLKEVRKVTLEAFENQDYKFGDLVDRLVKEKDPGRNPLFDVSFALQNMELPEMQIRDLKMTPIRSSVNRVRFDLNFMVVPDEEEPEVILEYCTKLFKEETIRMFIENFNQLITAVLENQHVPLQDIQISSGVAAADTDIPRLDLGF